MSTRNNNLVRKPSFSMERLEERQMMAGDVTAYMANGNLYVNEAAGQAGAANAVQVSQLSNGFIRVKGLVNQDGGTTLVDGQAFRDFTIPANSASTGHLVMYLGGGKDSVTIGQDSIVNKFNTISINTAAPNGSNVNDFDRITLDKVYTRGGSNIYTGGDIDYVNVTNSTIGTSYAGSFSVNTGDALDSVKLFNVKTRDLTDIRTGAGNDNIDVSSSNIGDGVGTDNLNITTGAGGDTILFNATQLGSTYVTGHVNVYAFDNSAEIDDDKVDMRSVYTNANINILMGAGNDNVYMLGCFAGADILLSGDKGNDTFRLTEVRSQDDFFAFMGDDADVLNMEYVGADEMILDGGAGSDSVQRWNNAYVRDLALQNWETINGVRQIYFTGIGSQFNKKFVTMN
jgi:hypothetical protein